MKDFNDDGQFDYPSFGTGPETVYIYYYKSYKLLAEINGLAYWPCKIGLSVSKVSDRLRQQQEAMPESPIVPFVIKTTNCKELEILLHVSCAPFNESRRWPTMPKTAKRYSAGGTEWYLVNPMEIYDIAEKYGQLKKGAKAAIDEFKEYRLNRIKESKLFDGLFPKAPPPPPEKTVNLRYEESYREAKKETRKFIRGLDSKAPKRKK